MISLKHVYNNDLNLESIKILFKEYADELNENLCFQSFEEELKNPLIKYGKPDGDLILAMVDNEIAGCIALTNISQKQSDDFSEAVKALKVCEMKRLYVKPQFRKHKIGEKLVEELLISAKKLGYNIMKLDTLERLTPAITLYQKFNFEIVTAYYQNSLPNVVYMQKLL